MVKLCNVLLRRNRDISSLDVGYEKLSFLLTCHKMTVVVNVVLLISEFRSLKEFAALPLNSFRKFTALYFKYSSQNESRLSWHILFCIMHPKQGYSSLPNKRTGPNKCTGWNFDKK